MAKKRNPEDLEELEMDLSPMIDLVFLLLVFFMVASTVIVVKQDPRVSIPVAENAEIPEEGRGRVVVNILSEQEADKASSPYADELGGVVTEGEITDLCKKMKEKNRGQPYTTRLHVRGDKEAIVKHMKKVVKAAAEGGVNNVIFSSYMKSKG